MIKAKSVLLTTSPAKDGTTFAISELEKALEQTAIKGIASCLGHDSAKPAAWTIPTTMFFEPKIARIAGITMIPENKDEQKTINQLHHKAIIERTLTDFEPHKLVFKEELKDKLSPNYKILSSTFVSCFDVDILKRYYPSLFLNVDKDGLVYIKDLLEKFDYLGQGVFADKKSPFAICAHAYFRKSLFRQNNLNFHFLDELMKNVNNSEVTLRLRLDNDLIGIAKTFAPAMEFEHWRGPFFNNDISAIKLGVSAHGMDDYNKLFNGIGRTEFLWKMEGGEQTFEAEEVKETPSLGISHDDYGCRYAHSIYDANIQAFEHFDGAIRMYDSDMIQRRWDHDIKSAGKSSIYTKLFRVDGKLALDDWKLLLHHYFQGNHLIEEYLGGVNNLIGNEPSFAEDKPLPLLKSILPLSMSYKDGLRLAVSYLAADHYSDEVKPAFYLKGYDSCDDLQKCVELDLIEIKKALNRVGQNMFIPTDYHFIECYDGRQWNIPEIAITDKNKASEQLPILLKAFAEVLSAKKNPEQTVAFTFSWPSTESRKIVLSILGTSEKLMQWLIEFPNIPLDHTKFIKWLKAQEVWLGKFATIFDSPRLTDVLCDDGTLFIKREPIFKYAVPDSINFEGSGFNMNIKPGYEEIYSQILENKIGYAQIIHVKEMICGECNRDYFSCPHSNRLDGTQSEIKKFQILGYYWVDTNN